MPANNRTKIILGALALVGVLATAVFGNLDKMARSGKEKDKSTSAAESAPATQRRSSQTISGNSNVQFTGSGNVINLPGQQPTTPKPCRDKSHGVESYGKTFEVDRSSSWMGGGFDEQKWCNQVISELRGQNPEGVFEVVSSSNRKENKCFIVNCPQYMFFCRIRVKTDPVYFERVSSACPK